MEAGARRVVLMARLTADASVENLRDLRDLIAISLARQNLANSASVALIALPAIASRDPDVCRRLWAVRRRAIGSDDSTEYWVSSSPKRMMVGT